LNLRKLLEIRANVARMRDEYSRAAERARETADEVARLVGDAVHDGDAVPLAELAAMSHTELAERGCDARTVQRASIIAERLTEQRAAAAHLAERLRDARQLLDRIEAYAGADS
jgi:hypothetical protein